jgi:hypothetical protein
MVLVPYILAIYRMTPKKRGNIEEIETCKTFLWRKHSVDRSTDP